MTTVYDFEALTINGKSVPLSQYQGKPMLIVNTASACGFTPQFAGLEELHKNQWTGFISQVTNGTKGTRSRDATRCTRSSTTLRK